MANTPDHIFVTSNLSDGDDIKIETIRKKLKECFRPSIALFADQRDNHGFLPKGTLAEVFTSSTIGILLQEIPETASINIHDINAPNKERTYIFAILILMEATKYMRAFIDHGLFDNDLPLQLKDAEGQPGLETCFGSQNNLPGLFRRYQFQVKVPTWSFPEPDVREENYDRRQRLPVLSKSELSSGGQGVVWKVELHCDHFDINSAATCSRQLCESPEFAVKEFQDRKNFLDELQALKHLSKNDIEHKCLIKVLAAFSQLGKHFLIFPLAKGSLEDFWQVPRWSSLKPPSWLINECQGLAEGLHKIHEYTSSDPSNDVTILGRHGDIKPQNILWFRDTFDTFDYEDGLVLSDFTLMRFHEKGRNQETTMDHVSGTMTYRAPEMEVKPHHQVTQKYDVWSLGCVFLEFISCYLVGYDATRGVSFIGDGGHRYQSFHTARKMDDAERRRSIDDKYFFHAPGTARAQVKESVEQWCLYLHGHSKCSDALHDFLDIVEKKMLVSQPEARLPIESIIHQTNQILDKSRRDTAYDCDGKLWTTSISLNFPRLFNEGEYQLGHQDALETWRATESSTGTLTTSIYSEQDLQQLGNDFFNNCAGPSAIDIRLIRPVAAVTGSLDPHQSNNTVSLHPVREEQSPERGESLRSQFSSGTFCEGWRGTADSQRLNEDEPSIQGKRRRAQSVGESETPLTKKRH